MWIANSFRKLARNEKSAECRIDFFRESGRRHAQETSRARRAEDHKWTANPAEITAEELTDEVLLQPWLLPREVASAIIRLLSVSHQNKHRYRYEDFGCFGCGTRKKPHQSLGFCSKCYGRLISQEKSSLARRVKADRAETVKLNVSLLTGSTTNAKRALLRTPQSDEIRDAVIRDLLDEISTTRRCPFCDTKFEARAAAENHFIDTYALGARQANHVATLMALSLVLAELLADAKRKLSGHTHYLEINKRASRLRKRHAKWQREGKRILNDSGTYASWDTRTW